MQRGPDSEPRIKWYALSTDEGYLLKTKLKGTDRGYAPKHLLGFGGSGYRNALTTLNHIFEHAVHSRDPEMPILTFEQTTALPAGRTLLSVLATHPGLGERFDAFVIMRHTAASEDLYEDALESIVSRTNRIFVARDLPPIPSRLDQKFSLGDIKGFEDLNLE